MNIPRYISLIVIFSFSIIVAKDVVNEIQFPKEITYDEILKSYDVTNSLNEKRFSHSLVYVTPW